MLSQELRSGFTEGGAGSADVDQDHGERSSGCQSDWFRHTDLDLCDWLHTSEEQPELLIESLLRGVSDDVTDLSQSF